MALGLGSVCSAGAWPGVAIARRQLVFGIEGGALECPGQRDAFWKLGLGLTVVGEPFGWEGPDLGGGGADGARDGPLGRGSRWERPLI